MSGKIERRKSAAARIGVGATVFDGAMLIRATIRLFLALAARFCGSGLLR